MSSPTQVRLPDRPDALPQLDNSFEGRTSNVALADASIDEGLGFLSQGGILSAMAKLVMESVAANGLCVAYAKQGSVICRASCGDIAPAVGTPLNLRSGIGAQCLRECKTITCADTETDPRVNREVCRRIGVRSILAVPLYLNSAVIGIAQAFYAVPGGFSEANVVELEQSADVFVSILPVDTSGDIRKQTANISPVIAQPVSKGATRPSGETNRAASRSKGETIEVISPAVTAAASAPEVAAQKLPSESQQIFRAAQSRTQPIAESVSVPQALQRSLREDVGETVRLAPRPAPTKLRAETAFSCFAESEQPVWWKRPTVAAVVLSAGAALIWVVTHTSFHPLVPPEHPKTSSTLEQPEVEASSLPFAQLQNKARAGDAKAQLDLARRYETGKGVGKNLAKAYSWYIVAAEAGNDSAHQAIRPLTAKLNTAQIAAVRFEVARMYANGIGVRTRDPISAYAWMVLAEAAGDRRAKAEQNVLAASMRPQEVAEAHTRASYWLKTRGYATR